MALLAFDGFDHYDNSSDLALRNGFIQWSLPTQFASINIVSPGRGGFGKCMSMTSISASAMSVAFGQRVASAFVGFGFRSTNGAATNLAVEINDSVGGNAQVTFVFNQISFSIQVYRGPSGGVLLGSTPNNIWVANGWNYVELWPIINNTTGSIEIRVNGNTVTHLTGIDTQITSNAWWDSIIFSPGASTFELDDFYYADTTTGAGTFPCNTPLGDMRVATLFATANNSVQWTPLANTNWQEISETAMDSDTSYNYSTTANDEDTFLFQNLSTAATLAVGVQVTTAVRADDSSTHTFQNALISGATEVYGTVNPLAMTYSYFTDIWVVDPATSASWDISAINALKAGYKLVS